jgi:hypothetical protein
MWGKELLAMAIPMAMDMAIPPSKAACPSWPGRGLRRANHRVDEPITV